MKFARELAEPWGLLIAATSAGAAWAVQLPVVAAVGVGVAVLAARAGVAVATREKEPAPREARVLDVASGSAEANWLNRAESAADGFVSLSESLATGPLAERVADMEPVVQETLSTLRRLAGRASATGNALSRVDLDAVAHERRRLQRELRTANPEVRGDLEQALTAVQAQADVHARLSGARDKLLAQLQSGALGLDSLVARVAELTAATTDVAVDTGAVRELSDQLEGIRQGVLETEQATRRSLG
ncbi:hypothetical protein DMA12_32575 [Amycolatopsis balhimycina DSM 5908]|uniref:Uncharacterized protein n=1 Tax=Amycolatopsis balhimycina DSM 5908 TaxID=1081091 RepID=A0A428W6C4_AMYBA|nr:hypothetical protein [Amycolatopsis balhimycina]RSM38620.1 hypothetical protein DMA12_32575 [Amycolatopsis balhimycina DSM 5908]